MTKEPTGLFRTDGKRPDGLTLVPWQSGKSLCWDVTIIIMPPGRIIRHCVHPRGSCCSGTRRFSQRRKICQYWKRIPLCAHRGRNLRPDEDVGRLPIWEERSPQPQEMRGKELFCSAESFGAGATLQRCLVT